MPSVSRRDPPDGAPTTDGQRRESAGERGSRIEGPGRVDGHGVATNLSSSAGDRYGHRGKQWCDPRRVRQHGRPRSPAPRRRPQASEHPRRKRGFATPKTRRLARAAAAYLPRYTSPAMAEVGRFPSTHRRPAPREHPVRDGTGGHSGGETGGPGRPPTRPLEVIAHRAHGFPTRRTYLLGKGIPRVIPERADQKGRRVGHPGGSPSFDRGPYARRNAVEGCANKLKQWRAVATRYDKRAVAYQDTVTVAALMLRLAS